jgi:hypothetical protein
LNRTKASSTLLEARLQDIDMPSHERLAARAHLARAEAISDLIVAAVRAVQSLARNAREWWSAWPARRTS